MSSRIFKGVASASAVLAVAGVASAAPGDLDTTFVPPTIGGEVRAVAALSDGRYLIGGFFQNAGGNKNMDYLARLNSDGSLDTSFTPPRLNGSVLTVAALSNGKYLIGGSFSNVGGDNDVNWMARLNSNGALDTTFAAGQANTGINDVVITLVPLSGGKVLIGGNFSNAGGNPNIDKVARLNADGSTDTTFVPTGIAREVNSVAALSDGSYLIGGEFFDAADDPRIDNVARLRSDGSVDNSFAPSVNNWVNSVAALSDGKYAIGGSFTNFGYTGVARLTPSGIDSTFSPPSLNAGVNSVAQLSDGRYLIGGYFTNAGYSGVARLNPDGSRDATFTPPSLNDEVSSVAQDTKGRYIIGGSFTNAGGNGSISRVARLEGGGPIPAPTPGSGGSTPGTAGGASTAPVPNAAAPRGLLCGQTFYQQAKRKITWNEKRKAYKVVHRLRIFEDVQPRCRTELTMIFRNAKTGERLRQKKSGSTFGYRKLKGGSYTQRISWPTAKEMRFTTGDFTGANRKNSREVLVSYVEKQKTLPKNLEYIELVIVRRVPENLAVATSTANPLFAQKNSFLNGMGWALVQR